MALTCLLIVALLIKGWRLVAEPCCPPETAGMRDKVLLALLAVSVTSGAVCLAAGAVST